MPVMKKLSILLILECMRRLGEKVLFSCPHIVLTLILGLFG